LTTGTFSAHLKKEARKRIAHKAIPYQILDGQLYRFGKDQHLRQVLTGNQLTTIPQELHKGNAGGHFSHDITVRKVLDAGYWWPTLHQDAVRYCQSCHKCQLTGGLPKTVSSKFITQLPAEVFMKWGLDFMGSVKKTRYTACRYILVATDYATVKSRLT
jgi:hypothetical protein